MQNSETPRANYTWCRWAMIEHTRLQGKVNEAWEALDGPQTIESLNDGVRYYERVCDMMDALEALPECCFEGHEVVSVRSEYGAAVTCMSCGNEVTLKTDT